MKRIHLCIIALCLCLSLAGLLYLLSGCSAPVKDEGIKYIIGISQPNLLDSERVAMNEEIKAELSKYSDIKAVFYDAANSSEKQNEDLQSMMKQRIDLLIIQPIKDNKIVAQVKKIYDSGIPVIIMGYPQGIQSYTTRIYTDNKKIGNYAGDYVKKILGSKGGTILEIQGDPDSQESIERRLGFREAIKNSSDIRVEYVVVGYWLRDKTIENLRLSGIFDKEPKIDVVYAHNDAMAVGARRLTIEKRTNAKIIGIEGLQGKNGGLRAVKNGIIDATFLCQTGGQQAVQYAIKILNREKVEKEVELKTNIIDKVNVGQYLKDIE